MPYGRAYEAAGYTAVGHRADQSGCSLAKNPKVAAALAAVQAASPDIADKAERQRFLTATLRGLEEGADMSARLRACELLGRMGGDFVDKSELKVKSDGPPLIVVLPSNTREG